MKESTGNTQGKSNITQRDIKDIQSIGRKSVNDFSSEDIEKTRGIAEKYYAEIGNKSPFFRAWFGDWRANDATPVHIVTEKDNTRGVKVNKDTGWNIQISGKVFNETKTHRSSNAKNATSYLNYINGIVENAILLDSHTIPSGKKKSENSVMMHSLYAIADMGNGNELVKLYVEELNDVNSDGTIKRAYQLQNIAKAPVASVRVQGISSSSLTSTTSADTCSVSDLFKLVKQSDRNFNPQKTSKVVNDDGTPKAVYHGTSNGGFYSFDTYGSNFGLFGNGSYFTESENVAKSYTNKGKGNNKQVYSVYLDIKNPIDMDTQADVEKWNKAFEDNDLDVTAEQGDTNENVYRKLLEELEYNEYTKYEAEEIVSDIIQYNMGYDGITHIGGGRRYDGSERHRVWIAFNPEQIKSATDNIGTFDKNNADIRFSAENGAGKKGESTTAYKVSQSLIEDYGAKGRVNSKDISGQIADIASKVYNTYYSNGDINKKYARLENSAQKIAEKIADGIRRTSEDTQETYDNLRKEIKSTKIQVTEEDKRDFADWNDFRKQNFGYLTLSKDGIPIDSFYKELTETHPDLFNESEHMTTGDQLRDIADTLRSLKPQEYTLSGDEYNEAVEEIKNEIISRAVNLADEMGYLDDTGNIHSDKIYTEQDMKEALKEQKQGIRSKTVKQLKEQRKKVRQQIMDKVNTQKERVKARKQESADRSKLLKLAREINGMKLSPENKTKIPDIVGQIDTVSKGILKKGYITKDGKKVMGELDLKQLKESYENLAKNNPDFLPDKEVESKIHRLDKMKIADMEIADVRDLIQVLQEAKHEIRTNNKLLNDERNREIARTAAYSIHEIEKAKRLSKSYKDSPLDKFVTTQLTPRSMARRLTGYAQNSTFVGLVEDLNKGQRKSMTFQQKAGNRFKPLVNQTENMQKFTGAKAELIDISAYDTEGRKVYITPAMRTALYNHSKNYSNLKHIQYGGITIPDMRDFKKGNIKKAYESNGITIRLTPSQVRAITSEMSQFEKQFADAAYKFFNEDCTKAINETSIVLKGYEIATVKDYFPIVSNKNFVVGDFETLVKNGTLEGKGMLQERKYSGNPVILEDITKVIVRHMSDVGDYSGLAIPIRNFNKVYNAIGTKYSYSTKQAINENWGLDASNYIERLITDLQGGNSQPKAVNWINKYAQATLSVNVGVTLKQAASYPTAAAVIGWKPLVKAFGEKVTDADREIIDKYTPLLWYRSQGYTTSEIGDYTNGTSEDWTKKGKIPWLMGWIQKMDVATTTKLWKAAEFYVRDNYSELEKGSEEYYNQVAEIYNNIIEQTQPNYTTMQRPDILRKASSDPLIKAVTMFKTQPMQNMNIMYDAFGEFKARYAENKANPTHESKAALKSAGKKLGLAIASQLIAAMVLNAFDGVGKYLKGQFSKHYGGEGDDDEGNLTVKSVLTAYAQDNISTLMSNVWFGSEAATLLFDTLYKFGIGRGATWYDMEMPELDMINNIINDYTALNKMIADKKFNAWYVAKKVSKTALDVATLFGIPAKNMKNLINGAYKKVE